MPVGYRAPAGGLPSAARALLTPENIRAGVHIKGGGLDVVGTVEKPVALIDAFSDGNNWDRVLARVLTFDGSLIASSSYATSNGGAAAIPFKRTATVRVYATNARDLMSSSITSGQQVNVTAETILYIRFNTKNGSTAFLITEV